MAKRSWDELKRQVYLGSEKFIEQQAAPGKKLKEISRAPLRAAKPTLDRIFAKNNKTGIAQAYREHGYRVHEIAKHLGVHYVTLSRRLKQLENSL